MFDFTGKVALVVGGAGYLCDPICRALAAQGAAVAITDLDDAKAEALAEAIEADGRGRTTGFALNAGSEASIKSGVARTVGELGGLDILINASTRAFGNRTPATLEAAEFDEAAHVQLTGSLLLAREAAAHMKAGGNIVMFSSMYGRVAPELGLYQAPMNPNPIDYGVTKAGLDQMIRYLAVYYAPQGIRVNGVAPGPFPNADAPQNDVPHFREFVQRLEAKTPLGRIGRRDEVVGPVVFLASDEASFVTGQILPVDGGWTVW